MALSEACGVNAEPLAIYVDGEGDAWVGMNDGTVSCLERVPDGDRYARWTLADVAEQMTQVVKVWSPSQETAGADDA